MTRPPIIFRLMLCSLFLPIFVGLCTLIVGMLLYAPKEIVEFWTYPGRTLGVPTPWIVVPLCLVLPFILYFWMFLTGNWRRPVLTAAFIYCAVIFVTAFEFIEEYTPPEKRTIHLSGIDGTDVYCNGVHLGQLPLEIRVDELMRKVPEWKTPPEQRWYEDSNPDSRLCTWVPWDNFLKERYEATKALSETGGNRNATSPTKAVKARQEQLLKHDAGCRYWWSYKFGDMQMAFRRSGGGSYTHHPFEKQSSYYSGFDSNSYSPSLGFHVQLLADVLPELSSEQKADWDRHVLKNWLMISDALKRALNQAAARHKREKNESLAELYETALHSTARLKYDISNPPTEEECRRLLADWVKASEDYHTRVFRFGYRWEDRNNPVVVEGMLIPADITEQMRKPLTEQWRKNKFRSEDGWAPVAYYSWKDKGPDYFGDLARFSATTGKARTTLLENSAPGTTALFKTLLYRRDLSQSFTWQIYLYPKQIETYSPVNNPLVEEAMREFIITALADPNHKDGSRNEVERAVASAIWQRMGRDDVDNDELADWVSTLPIPAQSKTLALRMLRVRSSKNLSFADRLQDIAGQNVLIETDMTLDDVVKWFNENPEGSLTKFLEEQEENIVVNEISNREYGRSSYSRYDIPGEVMLIDSSRYYEESWSGLQDSFIRALLRSDTPEGDPRVHELIRRLWTHEQNMVEQAILKEYAMVNVRRDYSRRGEEYVGDIGSLHLPEYILDLYLSLEKEEPIMTNLIAAGFQVSSMFALCESPKAKEILEKWIDVSSGALKLRMERDLETWQTRSALQAMKMEFFQDLVAGRLGADDLLLPQPSWVWKDGEYVQGE